MGTEAQEILANADFIYIVATTANDYAAGGTDISESLYNWLDVYAGKHPIIFDRYALCTAEPEKRSQVIMTSIVWDLWHTNM